MGDEARRLKPGDFVCWRGSGAGLGVVRSVERFGVVIRWANGQQTSPMFNDMKFIDQTDINGRLIEG